MVGCSGTGVDKAFQTLRVFRVTAEKVQLLQHFQRKTIFQEIVSRTIKTTALQERIFPKVMINNGLRFKLFFN